MGITEVKSPVSSRPRANSVPAQPAPGTASRGDATSAPQSFSPSPPTPAHDAEEPKQEAKSTDTEGEQEMKALPPLEEEPNVAADSVRQMTCADPKHLRQFEQLFGQSIFDNASVGVTGPDE
jgi:hypothetical protein